MATAFREISLPFRFDDQGRVAFTTSRGRQVADHLATIVGTGHWQRVMRHDYGSNVSAQLFENASEVASSLIDHLSGAIRRWEPSVTVDSVQVSHDPSGLLEFTILYSFTSTTPKLTYSATISVGGVVTSVTTVG